MNSPRIWRSWAPITFLLVSACSTHTIKIDFDKTVDFSADQTYAFGEMHDLTGTGVLSNSLLQKKIETAISAGIEPRGLKRASEPKTADLIVKSWVGVRNETQVSTYPATTTAYSTTVFVPHDEVIVRDVREGTLIVDLMDPKNGTLKWRAQITDILTDDPGANEKALNKALSEAFQAFPPAKAVKP